ncbi:hypothetical protein D3C87_2146280 [compost metagenome]
MVTWMVTRSPWLTAISVGAKNVRMVNILTVTSLPLRVIFASLGFQMALGCLFSSFG